ncbi:MAG: thermonuclease family protein [Glycocaulis sp.]
MPAAEAQRAIPGPLEAEVLRVIDGDTIEVRAFIWPGHSVETRVRLADVDAPKIRRVRCEEEREAGFAAKAFVEGLLAGEDARVSLRAIRPDAFGGRVVAHMDLADGRDLGALLLAEGHATPFSARGGWCPPQEASQDDAAASRP